MTDPIRAALDAAAEEVLKNLKDRRGIRQAIEQCDADVQAEIGRTVAAVGNAAFLRALPKTSTAMLLSECSGGMTSRPGIGQTCSWWAGHLADAVLAAAKEDQK